MFKSRFILVSLLVLSFVSVKADSMQKIEVLNNCAQAMNLSAKNVDGSFNIGLKIQAYAKALVIAQITELNTLQDQLFLGIFRNSAIEVRRAIAAGANVNKSREGKTPLAWALKYGMGNAAACLLQNGAR